MNPTEELLSYAEWVRAALALMSPEGSGDPACLHRLMLVESAIRRLPGGGRIKALGQLLDLSETEAHVVLVLAGLAVEPTLWSEIQAVIGGSGEGPTLQVLRTLVHGQTSLLAAHSDLDEDHPLRALGLIEPIETAFEQHVSRREWTISPRVLRYLLGDTGVPASISRLAIVQPGCGIAPPIVAPDSLARLEVALSNEHRIVLVCGLKGTGRRTVLTSLASAAGRVTLVIDAWKLGTAQVLRAQLRALALECRLTGATPLLCNLDALADEKGERLAIVANEFAPLIEGNILVTCGAERPKVEWDRRLVVVEMGQPTHAQRARLWREALGQGTEGDAERLANQYSLAPGMIVRAAEAAKVRAGERAMTPEDIAAGIRTVLDERLGQWARRVTVTQTWEDVVLPEEQIEAIVELMARVRGRHRVYEEWGFGAKVGRGLGVSALFSGPPGTGKTMVAGLIAKELGLEVYQVDMAKVVSKFIGETEKNLAAVFDAAEAGHAILLFDEADGLFGKRTDVRSSNDRYANFETNYLLQRLESFTGVCLLTTNHESNIDPAFQRRLSLHLRFELPGADERAALWRAVLPADAPLGGEIDFAALARRYAMSGGYIKNAALRAAFVAADRGEAITAAHLERAARVEYEGMGKLAA